MKKINFNNTYLTSKEVLFDKLIEMTEEEYREYLINILKGYKDANIIGIMGMQMPVIDVIGDNSDEVFNLLDKYVKEYGKPYIEE